MKTPALILTVLFLSCCVWSAELPSDPNAIPLWTGVVPGSHGIGPEDIPLLIPHFPEPSQASDCAIVICPGGGYGHHAMDHEGKQIAQWFNTIGVTAFVLQYRLPKQGYPHPVPLMDAQRALRLVRYRAAEWKINPDKIGIMGFSAGGHLASSAGTHFEKPVAVPGITDEIDTLSCRPDFMALIYPVISMHEGITHRGSRKNLLGPEPASDLVELMSNEKQVTPQTPPTFLVHADDDKVVTVENSIRFYQALHQAQVPAEKHIFLHGGHGFGMRPTAGPAAQWPKLCQQWLQQMKFLP